MKIMERSVIEQAFKVVTLDDVTPLATRLLSSPSFLLNDTELLCNGAECPEYSLENQILCKATFS